MQAIGFDNNKYLRMQSEKIRERIGQFGGKLYLEFGGKLLTTTMPRACCRALPPTARCVCSWR